MPGVFMVLNAGSSSLKFQIFEVADGPDLRVVCKGLFEGLGGEAHFLAKGGDGDIIDETRWGSGGRFGISGPTSTWRKIIRCPGHTIAPLGEPESGMSNENREPGGPTTCDVEPNGY